MENTTAPVFAYGSMVKPISDPFLLVISRGNTILNRIALKMLAICMEGFGKTA
jgi:hypothetical protein